MNSESTSILEPSNQERFAIITEKMLATYIAKNSDYGNSFEELRRRMPNAILVRLFDKIYRLETLYSGKTQCVNDESIDDTLLDLANYCVMELVSRKFMPKMDTTLQQDATEVEKRLSGLMQKGIQLDYITMFDDPPSFGDRKDRIRLDEGGVCMESSMKSVRTPKIPTVKRRWVRDR